MRTTLREKLLLWSNGLTLAVGIELISRTQAGPVSPEALMIGATVATLMAGMSTLILRTSR